jgi:hypothetical protein
MDVPPGVRSRGEIRRTGKPFLYLARTLGMGGATAESQRWHPGYGRDDL